MEMKEKLLQQLNFYYISTDIPLQVYDSNGTVLRSFGEAFPYCKLIREACGGQSFCEESHADGNRQSAWLKDGYIYECHCGLVHFSIPFIVNGELIYSILAGPVALEYPDMMLIDHIIEEQGCSLNYRSKLYGALSSVPIIEPVRLQYLNELLNALVKNLADICELTGQKPKEQTFSSENYIPVMRNALRYIDAHYQENINLPDVANAVGLNSSYFSTLFKQEMGINFSRFIIRKRIDEACRLLKETNMSLVAIASELGFDNQSYFSRTFKKQTGTSPKQYRQNENNN